MRSLFRMGASEQSENAARIKLRFGALELGV